MSHHFARSFTGLRARAGFKTAYSYYHSNGGRRTFPFTYAHYLKIERGGTLPSPQALRVLLKNLRRGHPLAEFSRLVRDYLRDMSGDDDVYRELFAPLSVPLSESEHMSAIRDMQGRLSENVTPTQLRGIAASPEATGCFMLLSNTPVAWTTEDIAEAIGASVNQCLTELRELRRHRLVRPVGRDHWQICALRANYRLPPSGSYGPIAKIAEHLRRISRKRGKELFYGQNTIRMELPAVLSTINTLDNIFRMNAGNCRAMVAPGPETALYLIEASFRRITSFP